jgi:hypothetical protein
MMNSHSQTLAPDVFEAVVLLLMVELAPGPPNVSRNQSSVTRRSELSIMEPTAW